MESTLFTALNTNEEANLSGGKFDPKKINLIFVGQQGVGGGAAGGGSINNGSGGVAGSVVLGGPGIINA
ncbi:hypothetical protein [uncultured Nostoc sp.]|uniref:hypothetical protein n=1 Tax=uncultured Nostoc sp. TaxID=340711 RepID=UPI0035CABC2D